MAAHSNVIDRTVRLATHRLPRKERDRIHRLCAGILEASAILGDEPTAAAASSLANHVGCREADDWLKRHRGREAERARYIAETAAASSRFAEQLKAQFVAPEKPPRGLLPCDKCEHGVYLAEWYCGLCRGGHENEPAYEVNKYAEEIRKALAGAYDVIQDYHGDYEDLRQVVAVEVWKAAKHYGAGMNSAIAYVVADNTRKKFMRDRVEHMSPAVAHDEHRKPVKNEAGEEVRFHLVSMDEAVQVNGREVQAAEIAVQVADQDTPSPEQSTVEADLREKTREVLRSLADKSHGLKREVTEAVLASPDLQPDIPAICRRTKQSRATVYRAYLTVRQALSVRLKKLENK